MKIDLMKVGKNDVVMIHHCIGNMSPSDVDKYCEKIVRKLATLFGKGRVAFFPVREGNEWDFTVIKKSI